MTSPRVFTPEQRERHNERKRLREAERRGPLAEYVVTITQEHFVNVRAADEEEAGKRALKQLADRWGPGLNPVVTEVEKR